jgi:hypothetical protein
MDDICDSVYSTDARQLTEKIDSLLAISQNPGSSRATPMLEGQDHKKYDSTHFKLKV